MAEVVANPEYRNYARTPETYLGYERIDRFASFERIQPNTKLMYTAPVNLRKNTVAYFGEWTVMDEYAHPEKGAVLSLNFEAKEVLLVMRPTEETASVRVLIDGQPQFFGEDAKEGIVTVDTPRLYKLINLSEAGEHQLELEFLDANVELYAFTFG